MPITGGQSSNNISDELITKLEGLNLAGGVAFRYSKEGVINLLPYNKTLILPATTERVHREVYCYHTDKLASVKLTWEDNTQNLIPCKPRGYWLDLNDGGMRLFAECDHEVSLYVVIRQDTEIDYEIGADEMPQPDLKLTGLSPGLSRWNFPNSLWGEMNYQAQQNIELILNPTTATAGHKFWAIDQFFPGASYEFAITPNHSDVGRVREIQVFLFKLGVVEAALQVWQAIQTYDYSAGIPTDLIGFVKSNSWYAKIPPDGGSFTVIPSMSRFVLFFDCENLSEGVIDTCFTTYNQNSDPKLGGTFEIVGF